MPLDEDAKKEMNRLATELMHAKAALRDQEVTTANAVKIVEDLRKENALLRKQLDRIIDKLIERATESSNDDDY